VNIFLTVIGSAAVGALVSAAINELGRWRERKSRREELVVAKAAEMAHTKLQMMLQYWKETGEGKIAPDALMLEDYYISLKHLLDKGELDPGMKARLVEEYRRHGIDLTKR